MYGNSLIRKDGVTPLFDGLGSERTVTNSSQSVTATALTDASGMTVASSGSSGSAYGFQGGSGYRSDGDGPVGITAFQKVGARYYDPLFGRFITRDTDLSQKPYAYCDGDPVNATDPTGHSVLGKILGGIVILGGAAIIVGGIVLTGIGVTIAGGGVGVA